jgi:hypothetical protein
MLAMTPVEAEQMPADCDMANTPSVHECCKYVLTDVAATLKTSPKIKPPLESTAILPASDILSSPVAAGFHSFLPADFHAPPPDPPVSNLNLRI